MGLVGRGSWQRVGRLPDMPGARRGAMQRSVAVGGSGGTVGFGIGLGIAVVVVVVNSR